MCVCLSNLEHSDVPGVALHGLLQLAALQALSGPNAVKVHVEVKPWEQATHNTSSLYKITQTRTL